MVWPWGFCCLYCIVLQRWKGKIFSQNLVLIVKFINLKATVLQIVWDKSKLTSKGWEEVLWHLVGLYESFNVLYVPRSWSSGFPLQGVNRNWCQSSVFYLTASLICGRYLLVGSQKSIFTLVMYPTYGSDYYVTNSVSTCTGKYHDLGHLDTGHS